MRKFITYILIAAFPLMVFAMWVLNISTPRSYHFQATKNVGCDVYRVYERMYESDKPIDIAFLGTSHTGCGIDDSKIDPKIEEYSIANLAYCRHGFNIQYLILKDLLSQHDVKKVFLEVRINESNKSHPDFGFIAELDEVLSAPILGNPTYLRDLFKAFQVRYMFFQDRLQNVLPEVPAYENISDYNAILYSEDMVSEEKLEKHLAKQTRIYNEEKSKQVETLRHADFYLEKIAELAKQNNAELNFLYLPAYGMVAPKPLRTEIISQYGEVIIPPKEFFLDRSLWIDEDHFNMNGAEKFSNWLADYLQEDLD